MLEYILPTKSVCNRISRTASIVYISTMYVNSICKQHLRFAQCSLVCDMSPPTQGNNYFLLAQVCEHTKQRYESNTRVSTMYVSKQVSFITFICRY